MNTDASGALYALLIGIDNYPNKALPDGTLYPPLAGCVRDIKHVEAFLLDRLGIPPSNISKLTATRGPGLPEPDEERPTYQNIVDKFKQLTDKAQSGDRIYIQYSGHGGRMTTAFKDSKGEDGLDEGLVPYDIANPEARYVRDIELAHLLKAMVDKGLIVTLVLDCCHSGGATRGVGTATARGMKPGPAGFDTREPPTHSAVASLDELTRTWAAATRSAGRGAASVGDWLSETRGYTLLAACRANEEAYEDSFDGKEKNGALTYWLLDSLRSMQPNTTYTYKDLHDRILAKIHSWMGNQTPELQGDGDLVVFGSTRIAPVYAVPILEVDAGGKRVKLNAGDVHGVGVGALLAAYPRGERDLAAVDKRQALLTVTELLGDTDSWAAITEDYSRGPIEQGGQAVLLGSTDLRLQRVVGVDLDDAALRQAVETAIAEKGTGFIRLQQGKECVDFQVALNEGQPNEYEIWDRAGVAVPNLRPVVTTTQASAAGQIVQRLVHLAKFRKIQDLSSPDPLAGKIKVEITDVPAGRTSGSLAVLAPGERFKLTITNLMEPNPGNFNDKSRILNITVLDLAPNWQIEQVLPGGAGAFELLQPGQSKEMLLEAYLPDGYDEAADIFKVFATQRTSGFRCLELPALDQPPAARGTRGGPSADPLEALLEAFTDDEAPQATEIASRHAKILSDPQKEEKAWAVAQVEVRVKKTL